MMALKINLRDKLNTDCKAELSFCGSTTVMQEHLKHRHPEAVMRTLDEKSFNDLNHWIRCRSFIFNDRPICALANWL